MKKFWLKLIPGLAWFFILLYLLCLPGEKVPKMEWLGIPHFDKIVHMGSFGLLTLLFFYPFYTSVYSLERINKALNLLVVLLICWGLVTELIQHLLIANREFDPFDWLFDSLGVLAARVVCSQFLSRRESPYTKKSP